jgi:hypothetical protein
VYRFKAIIAMLAVSIAGCNPHPPVSKQPTETPQPRTLAGRLPKSFESMSAAEFDAVANSVQWVGGHVASRCADPACALRVPVEIEANADGRFTDSTNTGANGTLLARVTNTGDSQTAIYHFRPAPYTYFFLVRKPVRSSPGWILLERQPGHAPDSVAAGPFEGCFDHPPATVSLADFRACGSGVPMAHTIAREPAPGPAVSAEGLFSAEAPGWISCAYGCCTMAY